MGVLNNIHFLSNSSHRLKSELKMSAGLVSFGGCEEESVPNIYIFLLDSGDLLAVFAITCS